MTSAPPPPTLSLQDKLDRIAHEREVLSLLRELATQGYREGDSLSRCHDGLRGRLAIHRDGAPGAIVLTAGGERLPFVPGDWLRLRN